MLRNYFKNAIRNLLRNKGYSFINILGLALGMAACILILLYISHELNYDKFHKNSENIYRVSFEGEFSGDFFNVAVTPGSMAEAVLNDFPEVTNSVRLYKTTQTSFFSYLDHRFYEDDILFADSGFFNLFSFESNMMILATHYG